MWCVAGGSQAPIDRVNKTSFAGADGYLWIQAFSVTGGSQAPIDLVRFPNPLEVTFMAVGEPDYH